MFTSINALKASTAQPQRIQILEKGLSELYGDIYNMVFPVFLIAEINGLEDFYWVLQQSSTHLFVGIKSASLKEMEEVFPLDMDALLIPEKVKTLKQVYLAAFRGKYDLNTVSDTPVSRWFLAEWHKNKAQQRYVGVASNENTLVLKASFDSNLYAQYTNAVDAASNICNNGDVNALIGSIVSQGADVLSTLKALNCSFAEVLAALYQTNQITEEMLAALKRS